MKKYLVLLFLTLIVGGCATKEDANEAVSINPLNQYDASKDKPKKQHSSQKTNEAQEETQDDSSPYQVGTDYDILKKPYITDIKDKIVIYEFFGYTCPHCFHFEPFINQWLENSKPDNVEFIRVPLNFQAGWDVYQQGYLTAELMGIADKTHTKLFEALHKEHKRHKNIDQLAQWYADEAGIDKEAFLSTADSFLLDSKQRKADKMGFAMEVTGTPAVVVNGKYKISKKVRNRDEIFKIVNYLAEKESKLLK